MVALRSLCGAAFLLAACTEPGERVLLTIENVPPATSALEVRILLEGRELVRTYSPPSGGFETTETLAVYVPSGSRGKRFSSQVTARSGDCVLVTLQVTLADVAEAISGGMTVRLPMPSVCVPGDGPAADALVDGPVSATFGETGTATHAAVTRDTILFREQPGDNFGGETSLGIDGGAGSANLLVALLRFDLSAVPAGATVLEANLHISTGGNPLDVGSLAVYEVLEEWQEGTAVGAPGVANYDDRLPGVAWTSAGAGPGSRAGAPVASDFMPLESNTPYEVALPTNLVQGWVAVPSSNFGIVFVPSGDASGVGLISSEGSPSAERPLLELRYLP